MATNVISSAVASLLGQVTFNIIDESSGNALWPNINVKSVDITSDAGTTDQPASIVQYSDNNTYSQLKQEDLQTFKIIKPAAVKVIAFCADLSTLEAVLQSFADTTLQMQISTKGVIVQHLAITNIGIEQNADILSAAKISIDFKQAVAPLASDYDPKQSADSSVFGIRIQSLSQSSFSVSNLTSLVAQKAAAIIPPVPGALLGSLGEPFVLDSSKLS